jgi:taurine dioxygenase
MMTDLATPTSRITVRRVAGHIGAEISDVDLSAPLSAETIAEIRSALLAHKVVFFRAATRSGTDSTAPSRPEGSTATTPAGTPMSPPR